jgi:hypothetical protein
MKKVVEFILRIETDETGTDVQIIQLDEENKPASPPYQGPLDVTVDNVDFVTTTTYHGSEEEWYITYKE